jgi:hypothetical protein
VPSASEVEIAIEKLKRCKSTSSYQIPAELIEVKVVHYVLRSTNLSILFGTRRNWKESIIVTIYKKGNKTDHSNYRGISLLSTTYKILSNILLSRLTPYVSVWITQIKK